MSFVKYNSSDAEIETVSAPEAPEREPEVKPEERPYVYEDSPLPSEKRPY